MPTIESCGSTLFYQVTGTGAPVLLVHSSACRGGFWRGLIDELGAGFSFYTPDLAGYGRSHCDYLNSRTSLGDEADFIAPLLWHDVERFHLIGHSFGGAVALATALAWPERVRSLTLYEPTLFSVLRRGAREDRELFEVISGVSTSMKTLLDSGSADAAMGHFVDFWNGASAWNAKPAPERAQFEPLALKVIEDFRMLFETTWPAHEWDSLTCPVLILRGDRSPPVARRVAEIVTALIGRARLRSVAGAGHMAPVTNPKLIATLVRNHLENSHPAGVDGATPPRLQLPESSCAAAPKSFQA